MYDKGDNMRYKELGKTGKKVSALGYGIMRMPQIDENTIDMEKSVELIKYAYEKGINYFDTAENYCRGTSENIVGEAVKGFRDKIHIATKVGEWHLKNKKIEDVESLLEGQLKRLQTDYIDFYLIHAVTDKRWELFEQIGIVELFEKKKREGVIKHFGFSYHGTESFYKELVDRYDWDFSQIQLNYVDTNMQAGESGLKHAKNKGLGTVIMEPLKGGMLTNSIPREMQDVLANTASTQKKMVDWGLNFLWNKNEVDLVLSGMGTKEQIDENIRLASESYSGMMSNEENEAYEQASKIYHELLKVQCTQCRYCTPCPQGVPIWKLFQGYNYAFTDSVERGKAFYDYCKKYAHGCNDCGLCVKQCPQDINVPEKLKELITYFENLK